MELIYLWIEDYKNIKKQKFDFSLKFIDNFFGDKINITAIVGKNGSGKSGILESIEECIASNGIREKDYIKFKSFSNNILHCTNNSFSTYQIGINRIYYDDIHNTSTSNKTVDLNYDRKETIQNYFSIFKENKKILNTKLIDFIEPDYISISRDIKYIQELIKFFHNNYFGEKLNEKFIEDKNRTDFNYFFSFQRIFILFLITKKLTKTNSNDEYFDFLEKYEKDFFNEKLNAELIKNIIKEDERFKILYDNFLKIIKFKNFYMQSSQGTKFIEKQILEKEGIYQLLMSDEFFKFFSFDFATKDSKRIYSKLSQGEKILFSQFVNLFHDIDKKNNHENLILLDEPYNGLHPEWQRVYINELLAFLKNNFSEPLAN